MELRDVQANWDQFGKTDPLWAIITDPTKRGGKWSTDEFFAYGRAEIAGAMDYLRSLPIELRTQRALDFGCGVGRLTQALCDYFDECHGVDIAPSMIRLAEKYNRFGARCHYHLNRAADLALFADDSFDFIYSNLVLQHMRPEYSRRYMQEFVRLLAPGGIALFQEPCDPAYDEATPGLTTDATALPDTAFAAQITMVDPPATMRPGELLTLVARVKNISPVTWPFTWLHGGRYQIVLGNHWLDRHRHTIVRDDGRAPLPHDVPPQAEINLQLQVHTPRKTGLYFLEVDMVQELVAWFKDRGSQSAVVPIKVIGDTAKDQSAAGNHWLNGARRLVSRVAQRISGAPAGPIMEMHGMPRSEVESIVRQAGGRVLDVRRMVYSWDKWVHHFYCATK